MHELANPYNRLQKYFFIIEELKQEIRVGGEYRIPLRDIYCRADVPIETFRSDISCLAEVAENRFLLVSDDEIISDRYLKENRCDWNALRKDMLKGDYDTAALELSDIGEGVSIPLTRDEEEVLEQIVWAGRGKKRKYRPFLIKDSYRFIISDEKQIRDMLYEIRNAIKAHKKIKVRLKKEKKVYVIMPVKLLYDATENLYAVLFCENDEIRAFRADQLETVQVEKKCDWPDDIENKLAVIHNLWGLDIHDQPLKVKVKIYAMHGRGNVGRSVRKDLENRKNGKLYEKGGFLYYEDIVYGKEAFLRWVFSYGSSMVVEKPAALRKEIVSILENFQKMED
ncbi:MAG: WYL domain-containing protein [Lachnospiraceae bacterium]|nr:WYL domain-containing protein [Lachnospiraceae bacterium]